MANYKLLAGVWEITYACNMRCKHCGSSCGKPLRDELTGKEALALCEDLGNMGISRVTLSGGEPFLRPDWPDIAKRLTQNGIQVNVISNGWYIDDKLLDQAFASGVLNIGVSIDGVFKTHDEIRTKGSWQRSVKALSLMRKRGMPTVVCTSINKRNLNELSSLRKHLIKLKVQRWQIQLASPMGNLLDHPELITTPDDLPELVNFCYDTMRTTHLIVDLADDIGYFSLQDEAIRRRSASIRPSSRTRCRRQWQGCQAGKHVIGIRANGDITPCLSIRDDSFIEANIRNTPLKEIWNRPNAFCRTRNLSVKDLKGFCRNCAYAEGCLGGCTGLKLTFQKHTYENTYCMFRLEMEHITKDADSSSDIQTLIKKARQYILQKQLPQALVFVNRVIGLDPSHVDALKLAGYIYFELGNYRQSLACNESVLAQNFDDAYALKGKGLCLTQLGKVDSGIDTLKLAVDKAGASFMDPYYDLAVVLMQQNRLDDARNVLDQGCRKDASFLLTAGPLYRNLKQRKSCLS